MRRVPFLVLLLAISACGGPPRQAAIRAELECVPFARALSGVRLRGNAADWWSNAEGHYDRGTAPETGAVMVFSRTSRLRHGHVAVVSRVLSSREVTVTQANWVRHMVTADQLVRDISPDGDWSVVRAWWPPSDSLGTTPYPVTGFIYPERRMSPEQIAKAVPAAVRTAVRAAHND